MSLFNLRFDARHELDASSRVSHQAHSSVVHWQGNQATLRLSKNRYSTWKQAHDLGRQMINLLEDENVNSLRVDMQGLTMIGSEALSQFARAHIRASQLGKRVVLENVSGSIRDVFHVTRLDRLVGLIDDGRSDDRWDAEIETELLV